MSAVSFEQAGKYLSRRVQQWDRRLRVAASVLWGPRGIIAGLVIATGTALVARTRPWLLPDQVILVAVAAVAAGLAAALVLVWAWPRSVRHNARYFDRRFGLKERVSTALELTGGAIAQSGPLGERQLVDAIDHANRVNAAAYLPLRVRRWEIAALLGLAVLLALLLATRNPQAEELESRRQMQSAIDSQAAQLEEAIEQVEANPDLSEAEQEALAEAMREALETLEQPDISQQEAMAALAEAAQQLESLGEGMVPEQQAAYQDAASELAGSELTSELAQALDKPDLGQAAEAMDDLAQQLAQSDLSQTEREDLAGRLDQAAEKLENTNPALAEKLREAAEALREGDIEQAQQKLREAAELMREQEQFLENSPMAQQAREAAQQMADSQQEIAQAGQDPEERQGPEGELSQNGQPQGEQSAGQMTSSEQSESEGAAQTAGEGEPGEGQQGMMSSQGEQGEGEGQPQAAPGGQEPGQDAASAAGSASAGEEGGQPAGSGSEAQGSSSQEGASQQGAAASGGAGAGEGEGGAGTDTTAGAQADASQGEISTQNTPGDGELQQYDPTYQSSLIGGESETVIDVGGEATVPGETPLEEGEFGENPQGESSLSYSSIIARYQNVVSEALESGRIPLDQRDVIHDYFSSLDQ